MVNTKATEVKLHLEFKITDVLCDLGLITCSPILFPCVAVSLSLKGTEIIPSFGGMFACDSVFMVESET